ncbi:hypothetical protein QC590_18055 [Pseudomonas putida]|uniref:hypothetical protein n=1 Tax=Pseudomonas TaxID=286 RepID=UPI000AB93731|nr:MULTISPECIES: hypothetical protein [Pseudomonas]MCA4077021.1 hypothetical protein [Pseudomonas kurunegalensis]
MVALALGEPMEIAGLLGNSHDKVMQSIERLDVRGAIALPPLGDSPTPSGQISNLQMFDG